MANQKSNLHSVQLCTKNLNLNKYKSNISYYDGFNKCNGFYFGNTLSSFFFKKTNNAVEFVDKNKNIYYYKDNSFYKNDTLINNLTKQKALIKTEIIGSGNDTYTNILGFVGYDKNETITDDSSLALCSNSLGELALVYVDGEKRGQLYKKNINSLFTASPFPKVAFIRALPSNNAFVASIDNSVVVLVGNEDDDTLYVNKIWSGSVQNQYMFYAGDESHPNYFTIASGTYKVENNTVSKLSLSIKLIKNLNNNTVDFDSYYEGIMIDYNNNACFYNTEYYIYDGTNYITCNSGIVYGYDDDGTLLINATGYYTKEAENPLTATTLANNKVLPANSAVILVGNDFKECKSMAGISSEKIINPIISDDAVIDYNYYYNSKTITEDVSEGLTYSLIDAQAGQAFNGVPLTYKNGTITNLGNCFRLLYRNGLLQAISAFCAEESVGTLLCGMAEIDSDSPIAYKQLENSSELYYKDNTNWIKVSAAVNNQRKTTIINNRYILLNTIAYYNCYDTEKSKWHHFASDYNDRCVFTFSYKTSAVSSFTTAWCFATAQSANYETLNNPFISSCFSFTTANLPLGSSFKETYIRAGDTPDDIDVDIYYNKLSISETPNYSFSQDGNRITYVNQSLLDTNYAFDFTLIPSIFAQFIKGYGNQGIIIDNNHTYLQVYSNVAKPIFAISFSSQLENISAAFIIQGQYFVIINNAIYNYSETLSFVLDIGNMQLLGYTPYQALFYSSVNKTIYSFTGDNTLAVAAVATEIGELYSSLYEQNTCNNYIFTSTGVYIFNDNQLIKLNIGIYNKGYTLNEGVALANNNETVFLSYYKQDGYDKIPIEIETMLYGESNNIKSVNDCVYIRLFDENRAAGKVIISSKTLNENTWQTEEKTINITTDMWDKDTKTLFIRYQPKNQEAVGFSLYIKTPFSIASLDISETPVTIGNSKINV